MKKEYIICAAVHYHGHDYKIYDAKAHLPKNISEGIVICGRRHHNCITVMYELTGVPTRRESSTQGFMTSTDRFVNRAEAYAIAKEAGQLLHDAHDKTNLILISEDIY